MKHLRKLFIICISAWYQYQFLKWSKGLATADSVGEDFDFLPPAPPSSSFPSLPAAVNSSSISRTNSSSTLSSMAKNDRSKFYSQKNDTSTSLLLLQPHDSLHRKFNISTTPIVIEKYKLLLFTIEKVGSTVLRQLMRRMMGYENYHVHGGGIPHCFPKNGLRVLTQYSLEEANEMMTSEEWTRAMFVRDPKERALSGYLMWMPQMDLFSSSTIQKAQRGLLKESLIEGHGGLGKCCKDRMHGNYNLEVLCLHHMKTFEGFLDMVEEPTDNGDDDDYDGHGKGLEGIGHKHNQTAETSTMIRNLLRRSPSCPDKHWSPVTQWRMELKFYPYLNFIGHLETAQWDIQRLLHKLQPQAWERYGASGWGTYKNESMFKSTSTVNHAKGTEQYLLEHYTTMGKEDDVERRVEKLYEIDYDNGYLDLERVDVGSARSFYWERYVRRFGNGEGPQ